MGETATTKHGTLDFATLNSILESNTDLHVKLYEAAKFFVLHGIPVVPLEPFGKRLHKLFTGGYTAPLASTKDIDKWFNPTGGMYCNLGILPGTPNGLLVIDLDIRPDKDGVKNWEQLCEEHGAAIVAPGQMTPSGGKHLFFFCPAGAKTKINKIAGVDIKASGHVVVSPSSTKQGNYTLIDMHLPLTTPPPWFIENEPWPKGKRTVFGGNRGNENVDKTDEEQTYDLQDLEAMLNCIDPVALSYEEWLRVGMALKSQHSDDGGFGLWDSWSKKDATRYTKNNHNELRKKWQGFGTDGAVRIGTLTWLARKNGWKPEPKSEPAKPGKVALTIGRLAELIENQLGIKIRYDEFLRAILIDNAPISLQSRSRIWAAIEERCKTTLPESRIKAAIDHLASKNTSDALFDYVSSLQWDGTDRLTELYTTMKLDPFGQPALTKSLIAGVARALSRTGVKVDTALIMVGPQGIGKSAFIRELMPDSLWFADMRIQFGKNKDDILLTQQAWAVELSELSSFRSADRADVKHWMTQEHDRVRPPYESDVVVLPRRFVVYGTTNDKHFLTDLTGNRRFWPMNVDFEPTIIDWLRVNRDQLWAQIKSLYLIGIPWWFTPKEAAERDLYNEQFMEDDSWFSILSEWLAPRSSEKLRDIMEDALGILPRDQTPRQLQRATNILIKLGWQRKRSSNSRVWMHPAKPQSSRQEF